MVPEGEEARLAVPWPSLYVAVGVYLSVRRCDGCRLVSSFERRFVLPSVYACRSVMRRNLCRLFFFVVPVADGCGRLPCLFVCLFVLRQMDFSRRDPILRGLNEFLPRLMPTREYGEFVRAWRSFPPGRQLRALSYCLYGSLLRAV